MKVAVFGGTFNPIHIGHAMLADTIIKELGYDKVLFVPTFVPPHKDASKIVDAKHRMEMISRFCQSEGNCHFELESCEVDRGGVSYTSDTLEYLIFLAVLITVCLCILYLKLLAWNYADL